ncbi:MAG TPA: oxygenase MpaB family protein [Chitinophagaceae bacterium]|nr:oxygenase MpaB family protein [Chitinophagaceae bacterium]
MDCFVPRDSIVRKIWGSADTILFVFAGASAEFALNKAVDWLYFTGRLPADPLARLFSTVAYAQKIVFANRAQALAAIDSITAIHKGVEEKRGAKIPAWAYRDVLFMLVDYSIRAFELLERKLTVAEKEEAFDVFYQIGQRMGLEDLPGTYNEWLVMREEHLQQNLVRSRFTIHLHKQYRKHLGFIRYQLLKQVQVLITPAIVRKQLRLLNIPFLLPVVQLYKLSRKIKLDSLLKNAILPNAYKPQVKKLTIIA